MNVVYNEMFPGVGLKSEKGKIRGHKTWLRKVKKSAYIDFAKTFLQEGEKLAVAPSILPSFNFGEFVSYIIQYQDKRDEIQFRSMMFSPYGPLLHKDIVDKQNNILRAESYVNQEPNQEDNKRWLLFMANQLDGKENEKGKTYYDDACEFYCNSKIMKNEKKIEELEKNKEKLNAICKTPSEIALDGDFDYKIKHKQDSIEEYCNYVKGFFINLQAEVKAHKENQEKEAEL